MPTLTRSATGRPEIKFEPTSTDGALTIRLPDARPQAASDAIATPLSAPETQALLARLEPLRDLSAQNAVAPSLRPASSPPPRPGPSQPIAFVVPHGKPVADAPIAPRKVTAPLVPPQISPQDEVRAESEVRVRFGEPMVPIAAVDRPAPPPATITPSIAGTWRWIDTRVATFTSTASRFPKATSFVVTVPAGIRALSGATLVAPAVSTFSTRPVEITGDYPSSVLRPDSPIVVQFDQAVDPDAILPFLRIETAKGKPLAYKPITLADAQRLWERNPSIAFDPARASQLLGTNHVIVAPATAWPAGIDAQVALKIGAPSKEGPRVTTRESFAQFQVAAPFTVSGITCHRVTTPRMSGATCPAKSYLEVAFSNSMAAASYRSNKIQIEGQPFQDRTSNGYGVSLWAPDAVGRQFTIAVGDGLVDEYGQPLIGPRRPTFTTGPERFEPYVIAPSGLIVLDPRFAIPQWVIVSEAIATLRVELYKVEPKDYFAFEDLEAGDRATPPGKRIYDKSYVVGPRHGANLRVDLRPALNASGLGHVIAVATATAVPGNRDFQKKHVAWIQVTKLGVTARLDGERVSAWVKDIAPARFLEPTANATAAILVENRPTTPPVTGDAEGHVMLELPATGKPHVQRPTALLHVQAATDSTFTAIDKFEKAVRRNDALWYVTDDRFTYKPGEPLYIKGWVRWTHSGVNPDLALPLANETVTYTLTDSRGNKLGSGTAPLGAQGGFDAELAIPANANLGGARLSFTTGTRGRVSSHSHPIAIQEFRTPAYAVTLNDDVSHSGATPLYLGETIEMTASAKYYSGGGLGGAKLAWDATLAATSYRPPNWNQFSFESVRNRSAYYSASERVVSQATTLSGASASSIEWGLAALADNRPSILTVDATVTDVDRASIRATSRSILVHPSTYYVGLRQRPGGGVLELVVTDVDGAPIAGVPIEVTIEGVLGSEIHRDDAKIVDTQRCSIASGTTPVTCAFTRLDIHTAYKAIARVADARGRRNAAQYYIPWWSREDRKQDLAVLPDRADYRPGDVAKLEIRSAVVPATAIVSFARQGIVLQKRVELATASTVVELPIEPAYIQNVHVVVDRIGKRRRQEAGSTVPLPEHVGVELELPVNVESARLVMTTRPIQSIVQPGAQATFEVEVRHDGKPKPGAEVALLVVDEAVLALSSQVHADPLLPFYRKVANGSSQHSTFGLVDDSGDTLAGNPGFARFSLDSAVGGGGSGWGTIGTGRYGTIGHGSGTGSGYGTSIVKSRKDFRATAVFSPRLQTDANGKVRLSVKMPDSLTRYRVVALATANTRYFGKAEGTIVTQRKVNARTVAPRFLSQGDAFALPIVVQNLDAVERTIDVAVRAANLVAVGPSGKRVTVPGGQRAEVRFEFTTKARGRALVQTIVTSGEFADASEVELPVYEPATTESFATYGTVDDAPGFEQLAVPTDLFADVGGIEVELASTQLQSLTDAYWYLYAYPYECAEQRSGRMIATAAMFDLLDAFATPGRPTKLEIDNQRKLDMRKLGKDQQPDGGWGYFDGMKSDPFVTLQVLTALALQRVSGTMTTSATVFVTRQANQSLAALEKAAALPAARRTDRDAHGAIVSLASAALTALALTGVDVRPRAERLHVLATALAAYPLDAKARLLAIVAKLDRARPMRQQLLTAIVSATHETAAAATVTTTYQDAERLLLVSSTKTSALALDAMMREAPEHALVTKLARGVLDGRRHGRWNSTQENLVALQTMRRYFDIYEKVTPNFTGKLWFGGAAYAEQAFAGRSGKRATAQVTWPALPLGSSHDIALVKDGPGRMYYRVGITYAPKRVDLPALDAGFLVRRSYTAVDDPTDVTKTAGGYTIRLGAKVQVTLEAINTTRRHGVALIDPLPAGFEAVNENLAIAERAVKSASDDHWDFINMRDNRSEAFSMDLAEGSHRFSYTVRATTPGTFLAAPAKAEEMYSPETFGRSAGQTVVIH